MGIVVIGAIFVDIKGYPEDAYIPAGRNGGAVEQIHGGVGRNVAEDVANCELRPTFVSLVDQKRYRGGCAAEAEKPQGQRGLHSQNLQRHWHLAGGIQQRG